MPVTAKLSRKFYEKLGDEVANELVEWFNQVDLTYRSELRELNELNYARFDARLQQVVAEAKAELRTDLASLRVELIRWMFVFWAGSVAANLAIILAAVRLWKT